MSIFNDIFEERKKMHRNVKVILPKLRIVFADLNAIIGHSWSDRIWDKSAQEMMI